MEKKENRTRLRLVKTDEPRLDSTQTSESENSVKTRSQFAQQMNDFADDLDRMIESILRS